MTGNQSLRHHVVTFRVQYYETDGQRRVHHSNYLNYFERGRVEMLRAAGISYKSFEDEGRMLVVTEMNVRYFGAAEFDDELTLTIDVTEIRKVRIGHRYEITRPAKSESGESGTELIVQADSVIACVDRAGKPTRLPQSFLDAR